MLKKLVIFIVFFFSSYLLAGQEIVILEQDFTQISIGKKTSFLKDANKEFSLDKVILLDNEGKFIKSEKEVLFFDYQYSTHWIKFTITNNTTDDNHIFLLIDYPLLYKIKVFVPTQQNEKIKYDTLFAGDGFHFNKREIQLATNVFKLPMKHGETQTFYLSVESDGDLVSLPISLATDSYILTKFSQRNILKGIFYGILLLIIIVNLFYYINMKDRVYLIYMLYVFVLGIYVALRDGFALQYFWQDFPIWINIAVSIFSMLIIVFILKIIQLTLYTKKQLPKLNAIIKYFIWGIIISILPVFIPSYYRFYINFGNILALLAAIVGIITIIISIRKKIFFAKFFAAAMAFLILAMFMVVMKNNGAPGIFQFEFWFKILVGIEIIVLAYGLSVRFNKMLEDSKLQAINRLKEINELKDKANRELETKVEERTVEIKQKNEELKSVIEELNQQKEEIQTQKNEIELQRDLVIEHQQKITNSIEYAKRIQNAVFPNINILKENFSDSFIFFKPKDVISGDFYWFKKIDNKLVVVVADCTGHSVPGAFMSLLGVSFLNDMLSKANETTAAEILNRMRNRIKETLDQTGKANEQKDGMDMALCIIDKNNLEMQYAGAYNSVYWIKKGYVAKKYRETMKYKTIEKNNSTLIEIKADRQPIAIYIREKPFENKKVTLEKGDYIYLATDGFADQFGSIERKKFLSKNFKNLLLKIKDYPMKEQEKILSKKLENWKKGYQQLDDILVLGVKI